MRELAKSQCGGVPGLCAGFKCADCGSMLPENGSGSRGLASGISVSVVGSEPRLLEIMNTLLAGSDEFRPLTFFSTAMDALRALPDLKADLVLARMPLPDLCAIKFARELRGRRPASKVILVSGCRSPDLLRRAALAGISHCLVTPLSVAQCLATLRFVSGEPARPAPLRPNKSGVRHCALSQRDEEILGCLAEGLSYKEIQDRLDLTSAVLKKVPHEIFAKFAAKNRTEAVIKWIAAKG